MDDKEDAQLRLPSNPKATNRPHLSPDYCMVLTGPYSWIGVNADVISFVELRVKAMRSMPTPNTFLPCRLFLLTESRIKAQRNVTNSRRSETSTGRG